jgi:low affinity Fe/Cu permease
LSTGRITAALVIACRPDGSMSQSKTQSPLSSLVYAADSFASRAAVALIVAVLCVGMLAGFAAGVVPASWELTFDTVAAAVTLTMVFSIQHAQTRHQAAIQLKLDELLKASDAPDRAVKVETASDDELHRLHREQVEHRQSVVSGQAEHDVGASRSHSTEV